MPGKIKSVEYTRMRQTVDRQANKRNWFVQFETTLDFLSLLNRNRGKQLMHAAATDKTYPAKAFFSIIPGGWVATYVNRM
jgi:hypothetical protein